ncbi:MAG: tetratricopeptide repeat protein [Geminicoccaceae bacterium]
MAARLLVFICLLLSQPAAAQQETADEAGSPAERSWIEASRDGIEAMEANDADAAEIAYRKALRIADGFASRDPRRATSANNLAHALYLKGELAEAIRLMRDALGLREQIYGSDHPATAQALNNLAELLRANGRLRDALPLHRRALAIRKALLGSNHPEVAQTQNNLAVLLAELGEVAEAEELHRQALEVRKTALGEDHSVVVESLTNLATLVADQGRPEEADPLLEEALQILEQDAEKPVLDPAYVRALSGDVARRLGKHQIAIERLEEAVDLMTATDQELSSLDQAWVLNALAVAYHDVGRLDDARTRYLEALKRQETIWGPDDPRLAVILSNLGELERISLRYQEAEKHLLRAAELLERIGDNRAERGLVFNNLAAVYTQSGRYLDAMPLLERTLALEEARLGEDHPDLVPLLDAMALVMTELDRPAEARAYRERADTIVRSN